MLLRMRNCCLHRLTNQKPPFVTVIMKDLWNAFLQTFAALFVSKSIYNIHKLLLFNSNLMSKVLLWYVDRLAYEPLVLLMMSVCESLKGS